MQEIVCYCDGKQMKAFTGEMSVSNHLTYPLPHANADVLCRQQPIEHPKNKYPLFPSLLCPPQ